MKRMHTIVTKVMPKQDRQSTFVHLMRVMLLGASALGMLSLALLLPAWLPTWLRIMGLVVGVSVLAVAILDLLSWYQKTYVPAREVYFYDRESWDEA